MFLIETLPEGGMNAQQFLVGRVLTVQHRAAQLVMAWQHQSLQVSHWCPVLFTDESRPLLNNMKESEDVVVNVFCNII